MKRRNPVAHAHQKIGTGAGRHKDKRDNEKDLSKLREDYMTEKKFWVNAGGLEFAVFADIEPAQAQTQTDPAYPTIVTINRVYLLGRTEQDLYDILNPALIQGWEYEIAEEIEDGE